MAKLSDLQLGSESIGPDVNFEDIPDQMGAFPDPPQPGPFRFRLPVNLGNVWDKAEKKKEGAEPLPRIKAKFDQDNPLLIIQSLGGKYDGEPFQTSISNVERKRRKDENLPEASDMDYLLRDGLGVQKKPKNNKEYAEALIANGAGKEFGGDMEWSWSCQDSRNIRVANGEGTYEEVEGQPGCGKRYYQKDVDKVPSDPENPESEKVYPLHITCGTEGCGADLRAFASINRFRK